MRKQLISICRIAKAWSDMWPSHTGLNTKKKKREREIPTGTRLNHPLPEI